MRNSSYKSGNTMWKTNLHLIKNWNSFRISLNIKQFSAKESTLVQNYRNHGVMVWLKQGLSASLFHSLSSKKHPRLKMLPKFDVEYFRKHFRHQNGTILSVPVWHGYQLRQPLPPPPPPPSSYLSQTFHWRSWKTPIRDWTLVFAHSKTLVKAQ